MAYVENLKGSARDQYVALPGKVRFSNRNVELFHIARQRIVKGKAPAALSDFATKPAADGQALAGTGALVFEGELLTRR